MPLGKACQPKREGCSQDPALEVMWAPSKPAAKFADGENEALSLESQRGRQAPQMRGPSSLRIFCSIMLSGTLEPTVHS